MAFDEREPCVEVFVVAVTDANNSHNIRSRTCKRLCRDNIKRVPADAGPRPTTLLGRLLSAGVPREFAIKLEASRGKREYASRMTIIAPRTT